MTKDELIELVRHAGVVELEERDSPPM